jgi:basic membrane protein A and related proteins
MNLSVRVFLSAVGLVVAALLTGCGKTDVATVQAERAEKPLKIAFVYNGPVADAGWNLAHDNGRKAVEREFGPRVATQVVENIPDGADAERVIRELASQGDKLVFGTSFGYMDSMMAVAKDNEGIRFEHATGYKTSRNMRTYDCRTYEGAYLAGLVAGSMTRTNILGVVASMPIPEVVRNIDAFTLAAQSVNPRVKTKVVWVNEWFDPPKETEAAVALIDDGADVLMQNTNSVGPLKAAEERGKRAFGWNSDMSAYGPKAHLGSAVINWGPYYVKATRDALEGTWTSGQSWWGVKEGTIDFVSLAVDVPAAARARLDAVKAGLKNGTFVIWKGPIVDNTGEVRLARGVVADDKFLGGIKFYVNGVEGRVPGVE